MSVLEFPTWFNDDLQNITDKLSPRIVSLQPVRSVLDMVDPEVECEGETDFDFGITAIYTADKPGHVAVFADTSCRQGRMFAGNSTLLRIALLNPPEELTHEDVEALSYWALHPLYDFTLRNLNGQIAGNSDFSDLAFPASPGKVDFQALEHTQDGKPEN